MNGGVYDVEQLSVYANPAPETNTKRKSLFIVFATLNEHCNLMR